MRSATKSRPKQHAFRKESQAIRAAGRRKPLRIWTPERSCNQSTMKKSFSWSTVSVNACRRQKFTFGNYSTKPSKGIFRPRSSSRRWRRNTSDLKLRGPQMYGSLSYLTPPTQLANQTDAEGSYEHWIPKSSKGHSVRKRPLWQSKGATKTKPAASLCWVPVSQGRRGAGPDRGRRQQNRDVALGRLCPPNLYNGVEQEQHRRAPTGPVAKAISRRFATRGSNYLLNYGGRRETLRSRRVDSQNERLWNASDRTERKPKSVTSAS